MDPGSIAAVSALFGSAIGALASLATSWSTHHYQDERQRSARENVRRERIFVEFIEFGFQGVRGSLDADRDRGSVKAHSALRDHG